MDLIEPVQWSLRWPTESSFGNIFAKWSDLTISDQTRSRLQSARDYIEADTPPTATASMTSEGKYYRAALNFRSRFERGPRGCSCSVIVDGRVHTS